MFPENRKGKSSKFDNPSKVSVFTSMLVTKTTFVVSKSNKKAKDFKSDNINQILETMHAYDNPIAKKCIEKILSEKLVEEPIQENCNTLSVYSNFIFINHLILLLLV